MRKVYTKRYQRQVPGHHIQMDVKFLTFIGKKGGKMRRLQYTAIDAAIRIRALKVYEKHTQANNMNFVNHLIDKFPFWIREMSTDNSHEFQAKFHWHVEDLGIRHAYFKRGTPQLNGKLERAHRSGRQEFKQCLAAKAMLITQPSWSNESASTSSTDRMALFDVSASVIDLRN